MLSFLDRPFTKQKDILLTYLKKLDQLRQLKSKTIFKEMYKCLQG